MLKVTLREIIVKRPSDLELMYLRDYKTCKSDATKIKFIKSDVAKIKFTKIIIMKKRISSRRWGAAAVILVLHICLE